MIPDAVLSALVEVKRAREATREIAKVQEALREATKDANVATAAVNRFGRVRGIAVLDVNSAKAQAQTAAAQKAVNDFGRANGTATLDVNGTAARREMATTTEQLRLFSQANGTAKLDADATRVHTAVNGAALEVKAFGALRETATVQVDAAQARREMAGVRRDAEEMGESMRKAGGGGRDGGNGIRWFVASFGDLPGRIYLSTRLLGALMNILVTMAPVLAGLAAQFVALASAMAPIAGLAAGVGGAMVAAAQGMAVFKLATAGVADAIKASGKDAEKFREELEKLPPAAQAFTREVVAMKPRLDELRATAAGGFFPGASAGLSAAMGSFSSVNRVVGQTSTVLGEAARKSGELVGSPAFGRDIEIIGGRNAKVLDTLGQALRHMVSGIRNLLVSAGPLTQWLANVANAWALNFAEARKAGRETGRTAEFFEKAKNTAQLLGSILSNLGSAFMGIGRASEASGRSMLESLDRLTERFAKWANSVKGRNDIAEFMESARKAMASLSPAFGALVAAFTAFAMNVLPVYATVLRALEPIMGELVTTFLLWKVAATGAAIATGALKAAMLVAAFATGGWTTAFWALNAAMAANPIGLVVVALAALVAGLVLAYKNSETFRRIVDGALRAVGAAFDWMVTAAKNALGWLASNWQTVTTIITGPIGLAVGLVSGHADEIVGFFTALPGRIAGAIMAGAAALATAVLWLKDRIVGGIKAYVGLYVEVGRWLVNRIVDGVKAMAGALADAAGWLKNRVVEGVRAAIEAFKSLGGWIVNRIVEGIKVVGEALASVGGWLKNRIVELVHAAVEGFKGLGGWVLNRIVEGFKIVTEALGSVGGWLKNRLVEGFGAIKDAFMSIGGSIMGWIVDGLKGGVNLLIGFINKIIDVINKIPGVDIKHVKELAKGGAHGGSSRGGPNGTGRLAAEGLARGGAFARTGGFIDRPITLMGEEAPRHPEFVIPTNPAYRGRAQMLLAQAAGAVGLAEGGVIQGFRNAIRETGAGAKAQLALWMAGIVESGLRNLPYGDRDSVGALQQRPSQGWTGLMNPFKAAMEFLARAIPLAGSVGSAGQLAQAVQRSAYPERYDAVREQASQYLKGGGGGGISGAIAGLVGKVGGVLGDLLSKGAGFLLDKLPGVGDLPDWLKGTGKWVLDKATGWIKDKVAGLVGAGGGATGPAGGGGAGTFDGRPVAKWIIPILKWARSNGWGGSITSGVRTPEHNAAVGGAAGSNHLTTAYPGGAVDVGGWGARAEGAALAKVLAGYDGPRKLVWAGPTIGDWGHFSATGYAKGGVYGPAMSMMAQGLREGGRYGVLGSFRNGTDYVPRTGPYELHRGERVTPAGQNNDALIASNDRLAAELRDLRLRGVAVVTLTDQVGDELGDRAVRRSATGGDPNVTHRLY